MYSSLDMGMILNLEAIIIEKKINKSPSQIMFTVIWLVSTIDPMITQVWNRILM